MLNLQKTQQLMEIDNEIEQNKKIIDDFTDSVTVPACVYPLCAEEYADFAVTEPESGQPCIGTRPGNPAQYPYHSLSFQGKLYGTEI